MCKYPAIRSKSPFIDIPDDAKALAPYSTADTMERQEKLLETLNRKRRTEQVVVPSNPELVNEMLREIGEPVTIFGDREYERRIRLKGFLAKLSDKQVAEFTERMDLGKPLIDTVPIQQTGTFYTEGLVDIKTVRLWLAKYSVARAKGRLIRHKEKMDFKTTPARVNNIVSDKSELADDRPVACCAFTADGNQIVTAGWTGIMKIWSSASCSKSCSINAHQERITGLATNPNRGLATEFGPAIATGSADRTAKLWSSKGKALVVLGSHSDRLSKIAFHPSGRLLATACFDQKWRLWDLERTSIVAAEKGKPFSRGRILYEQEGHGLPLYSIGFQCDGSLLASGGSDSVGRVWDLRTGRSIMTLEGHVRAITALDFSPDGYHIVTGSLDNSCQVWDLRVAACQQSVAAHNHLISHVRYRPEVGNYFVTAGYDYEARVWSAHDCRLLNILAGHDNKVMSVDIHPDPTIEACITVGYDKTLKLWKQL